MGPKGQVRSINRCILLAIVTLGIYTFVWTYRTHQEIKDYSGIGVGGGWGLLVYIGATIVTFFLVPNDIDQMLERRGVDSRVSVMTGFWGFLPIIGAFVWFTKVQGQLNEFWTGPAS